MKLTQQISEMPTEKQIAWLLRLLIVASLAVVGALGDGALQKLDRISDAQASQGALLARLVSDDALRRDRLEQLYELHYRATDRIRALEVRLDQMESRGDPERK